MNTDVCNFSEQLRHANEKKQHLQSMTKIVTQVEEKIPLSKTALYMNHKATTITTKDCIARFI